MVPGPCQGAGGVGDPPVGEREGLWGRPGAAPWVPAAL